MQEADQLYNVPKTGNVPHLVGEHLLKYAGLKAGSAQAHAHTYLDFERAALQYGKVGGLRI